MSFLFQATFLRHVCSEIEHLLHYRFTSVSQVLDATELNHVILSLNPVTFPLTMLCVLGIGD